MSNVDKKKSMAEALPNITRMKKERKRKRRKKTLLFFLLLLLVGGFVYYKVKIEKPKEDTAKHLWALSKVRGEHQYGDRKSQFSYGFRYDLENRTVSTNADLTAYSFTNQQTRDILDAYPAFYQETEILKKFDSINSNSEEGEVTYQVKDGHIVSRTENDETTTYQYEGDKLSTITAPNGVVSYVTYDGDKITKIHSDFNNTDVIYDNNKTRVESSKYMEDIATFGDAEVDKRKVFTYDNNQLKEITADGVSWTLEYDDKGRLIKTKAVDRDQTTTMTEYTYNKYDLITAKNVSTRVAGNEYKTVTKFKYVDLNK